MKALILNSGLGSRMGELTKQAPKCMVEIAKDETIVKRQIRLLVKHGITQIVMTTGAFNEKLEAYIRSEFPTIQVEFVYNSDYQTTNYIYSIDKASKLLLSDIVLMHGDLVFDEEVLEKLMASEKSCVAVCEKLPLPDKDFKAVIKEDRVQKIGIEFFDNALPCQPLYKLNYEDWVVWLRKINEYCERGEKNCYAEKALNDISSSIRLYSLYLGDLFCKEIDNIQDLETIKTYMKG